MNDDEVQPTYKTITVPNFYEKLAKPACLCLSLQLWLVHWRACQGIAKQTTVDTPHQRLVCKCINFIQWGSMEMYLLNWLHWKRRSSEMFLRLNFLTTNIMLHKKVAYNNDIDNLHIICNVTYKVLFKSYKYQRNVTRSLAFSMILV